MMDDLISRQAAIKAIEAIPNLDVRYVQAIEKLPSARSKIKPIDYQDCANAMLKMWMDEVVTDGEYNRIMDKLNALWRTKEWTI